MIDPATDPTSIPPAPEPTPAGTPETLGSEPLELPTPIKPSEFLVFMPTYAPETEAVNDAPNKRPYHRIDQQAVSDRINDLRFLSRMRPWVYMDAIDSILNVSPNVDLVVADARSTDSIREHLIKHQAASITPQHHGYDLALFPNRESQWQALNKILELHSTTATKYFVYTSSDIVWTDDWLTKAVAHFDADPTLQLLFPCVNSGDENLPCQISTGPRPLPLIDPPYQHAARAPVLNAYAFICRIDFLRQYGGYPTIFRNCFTESFLYYMCEAIGGKMRLMPDGWLYHHNGIDQWVDRNVAPAECQQPGKDIVANGLYYYNAEKPKFDKIMDQVQIARSNGTMTKEFLRSVLYV